MTTALAQGRQNNPNEATDLTFFLFFYLTLLTVHGNWDCIKEMHVYTITKGIEEGQASNQAFLSLYFSPHVIPDLFRFLLFHEAPCLTFSPFLSLLCQFTLPALESSFAKKLEPGDALVGRRRLLTVALSAGEIQSFFCHSWPLICLVGFQKALGNEARCKA